GQVVEHKHEVFDLTGQVFVDLADRVHQLTFDRAVEEVHDVGSTLDTTQGGTSRIGVAGELFLENLVELFQRRRLHGIERGNPQNDIQPHLVIEIPEHLTGLV